ncbi:MAG: nucleotidyl transferase AbiEii/AbiGii toxin family protein [Oligoflexus sp.]
MQRAKDTNRPFQEVLQYYAMERFLYRLSQSSYNQNFVLKGALMLRAWNAADTRPTRDIDLLGQINNETEYLTQVFREICAANVEADGIFYDPATVKGEIIKENATYHGTRIIFRGKLENASIPMQIDIGFGDVVSPKPMDIEYPTILDFPAPKLNGYRPETVIAEKFQAIVALGTLNSRMKDFYDIWLLSRQFNFKGANMAEALDATFKNRNTPMLQNPDALQTPYTESDSVKKQWAAFIKRNRAIDIPVSFVEVANAISKFVEPFSVERNEDIHNLFWTAPGPWNSSEEALQELAKMAQELDMGY